MKFTVGDDIIVRKTSEKGKVIEILSDEMIMIRINRVDFPVYIKEIDFPYFDLFTKQKFTKDKKQYIDDLPVEKYASKLIADKGFYILFMPVYTGDWVDEKVEKFKIYFFNNIGKDLGYEYDVLVHNQKEFMLKSEIKNNAEQYIHDITFESAAQNPIYRFVFLNIVHGANEQHIWDMEVKIKSKKLFELIHTAKLENKVIIPWQVFEEIPSNSPPVEKSILMVPVGQNTDYIQSLKSSYLSQIIDLHIEKLVDNTEGIQAFEKLQIQLTAFEKALDTAILNSQEKLTVIHGIGKGVLLERIIAIANTNQHIKRIVNEYDSRYGYGATRIYFK